VGAIAGAQIAAQRKAVLARHHDVEHDEIDTVVIECRLHLPTVRRSGAAQPLLFQIVGKQAADVAVVVDDQNVVLLVSHLGSPWAVS